MAGANEGPRQDISLEAAADLSAKQYTAVKMTADKNAAAATAQGELTIGILQNAPDAAGKAALVAYGGRSKAVLGGTVTFMAELTTGTAGKLEDSAASDYTLALALQDGVVDDIIDVLIVHHGVL